MSLRSVIVLFLVLTACGKNDFSIQNQNEESFISQVIYGEDNRLDLYEVTDPNLLVLADSTLGLISSSSLTRRRDGLFQVRPGFSGLCSSERFSEQPTGPWCSGFLVGEDLIVTAGHCIQESNCSSVSFIFGYDKRSQDHNPTLIPPEEIYKCAEVVGRVETQNAADWAVVRLDRPVTNHLPLKLSRRSLPLVGTPIAAIGHPIGLPKKVTGQARIRSVQPTFFTSNLDTYGGNSGSAVFNVLTGEVEGILVRGEQDFFFQGGCRVSNRCLDNNCRGESSTNISQVLHLVPELGAPVPPEEPNEFSNSTAVNIPDRSFAGAFSVIENIPAVQDLSQFQVEIALEHTYISDLRISLLAPNGQRIVLHNRSGGSADDIFGVYGEDLIPVESLSSLSLQQSGDWRLHVQDFALFDRGRLLSWKIIMN